MILQEELKTTVIKDEIKYTTFPLKMSTESFQVAVYVIVNPEA